MSNVSFFLAFGKRISIDCKVNGGRLSSLGETSISLEFDSNHWSNVCDIGTLIVPRICSMLLLHCTDPRVRAAAEELQASVDHSEYSHEVYYFLSVFSTSIAG